MGEAQFRPQRLFTAITLPPTVVTSLMRYQPPSHPTLRQVEASEMHLTLCFIGPGYVDSVDELLRDINGPELQLGINGLGRFSSRSGSCTLWAGIDENPLLRELQSRMAQKLRPLLQKTEKRTYRPHISLARGKPGTPQSLIDAWLEQEPPGDLYFDVGEFCLYSSNSGPEDSRYTREKRYPLYT